VSRLARPRSWPIAPESLDPWASDGWLETVERDPFARAWNRAMQTGDFELLQVEADDLDLVGPLTHDVEAAGPAPEAVPDALLAAVMEDFVPDITPLLDVLIGPWADERPERPVLIAAAATLAHLPVLSPTTSATRAWANRPPRPPRPLRASIWTARDAPPMLWRTSAEHPWEPLLPLAPCWVPTAPTVEPAARLGGRGLAVARLYPDLQGSWHASGAIGLPEGLPVARLRKRLEAELWRQRRGQRLITWEGSLRARPEVLYRSCATWSWWRCEEP